MPKEPEAAPNQLEMLTASLTELQEIPMGAVKKMELLASVLTGLELEVLINELILFRASNGVWLHCHVGKYP